MLNVAIENQNGWNYSAPAPHKAGAGRGNPMMTTAHNRAQAVFLCVMHSHIQIMVGRAGQPKGWPVSVVTGISTPVRLTTLMVVESLGGELFKLTIEAAIMATTPALVHSQTAFIWRFIIFGASESQIIHVTAWTEREARSRCPSGCVAVFAARIRQGVSHA